MVHLLQKGYVMDGVELNISDKDQKWEGIDKVAMGFYK